VEAGANLVRGTRACGRMLAARAAGGLAASCLALARTELASANRRTQRLTLELSGSINREAIDLSA